MSSEPPDHDCLPRPEFDRFKQHLTRRLSTIQAATLASITKLGKEIEQHRQQDRQHLAALEERSAGRRYSAGCALRMTPPHLTPRPAPGPIERAFLIAWAIAAFVAVGLIVSAP